jgi:hypothetical protein
MNIQRRHSGGVVATEVVTLSTAAAAGLERGDIITEAGGKPILSKQDFDSALENLENERGVLLLRTGRSEDLRDFEAVIATRGRLTNRRRLFVTEIFLKKTFHFQHSSWMQLVSLIRSFIQGFSKNCFPLVTAAFLFLLAPHSLVAADSQASPTPENAPHRRHVSASLPASRAVVGTHPPRLAHHSGIFLVVVAVLVYVLIKFRPRGPEDHLEEPPQVYGSYNIEMAWTVIPCIIVFVLVLVPRARSWKSKTTRCPRTL